MTSGNATIYGGGGNDIIFGGYGNDSILGGTGNAGDDGDVTVYGGGGNDIIYGGYGNDSLSGGSGNGTPTSGNATIYGGGGNDIIYGGYGNDSLTGGSGNGTPTSGNATIYGGGGNDIIFGGYGNDSILGGSGNAGDDGDVTVYGGGGNDVIYGGYGNDSISSGSSDGSPTSGSPTISGGGGNDIIFGGGNGWLVESGDGDFTLSDSTLSKPGNTTDTLDGITHAVLNGGQGPNRIDASAFQGPVALTGGGGNDTLIGGSSSDTLTGGAGDDSLVGGGGNDTYLFPSANEGSDIVVEKPNIDNDELNFADFPDTINLDLSLTTTQVVHPGKLSLTLSDAAGFERVIGSAFPDTILGNSRDNQIYGAGGVDHIEGREGNNLLQGGLFQTVYLDFVTNVGRSSHVYTAEERDAIQARLSANYGAFHYEFTQTEPSAGPFVTLYFNVVAGEYLGGEATELDWRDLHRGGSSAVDVSQFLGGKNQPEATTTNFINLSATIAAHELGHLAGLRHGDSLGPIGSGIYSSLNPDKFTPSYPGNTSASETPLHILASPRSVGITLFDSASQTFFGEREDVKLAFADTGQTVLEQAASHDTIATAQMLDLAPLAVPSTLIKGQHQDEDFAVKAVDVVGSIQLGSKGHSENDLYAFSARAGEVFNIEVMSQSLTRILNKIDSIVSVRDAQDNLIPYGNGGTAINDDSFESLDAILIDLLIPADGTYYITVDTYAGIADADTGNYELFLYSFQYVPKGTAPAAPGDTLVGSSAGDTLVGSSGNDLFQAPPGAEIRIGSGQPTINTPPQNVSAGGPFVVNEGTTMTLDGQFNDPDPDQTHAYSWRILDSQGQLVSGGTSASIDFTPQDNDTFTVLLTVTDSLGGIGRFSTTITAENVAPAGTLDVPASVGEGTPLTLALSGVTDPGTLDTEAGFTYAFDLGDGNGYGAFGDKNSITIIPADNTPPGAGLAVGIKVRDKDGGIREYTTTVNITNTAPSGTFNAPASVAEGGSFTLSLTGVNDPGLLDRDAGFTYAFDLGDGNGYGGFSNTNSIAAVALQDGPRIVGVMVRDKDGGTREYTRTVNVISTPPTLRISGAGSVTAGEDYTLTLSAQIAGNDPITQWTIDWGDGETPDRRWREHVGHPPVHDRVATNHLRLRNRQGRHV